MTQIPAGWYPDPAPAQPGQPPLQRWWDGTGWTEHVQPAEATAPYGQAGQPSQPSQGGPQAQPSEPGPPSRPPAYPGTFGQASSSVQVAQPYPAYEGYQPAAGYPQGFATTPDGQRLAGWWHRVGAYLIDWLILTALATALGWPFVSRIGSAYGAFFREAMRAAESGGAAPGQGQLIGDLWAPLIGFAVVSLVVNFVYNVGFLKTLSGTPGKLLTGLRVRLRETPGKLSWGTVLKRWLAQNIRSLVAFVPVLGAIATLYPLLDDLWPLWDDKKQALHDKFARTNVVVQRRG